MKRISEGKLQVVDLELADDKVYLDETNDGEAQFYAWRKVADAQLASDLKRIRELVKAILKKSEKFAKGGNSFQDGVVETCRSILSQLEQEGK